MGVIFGSIYLVARYNPVKEISNINCLLVGVVSLLIYVVAEFLYEKYLKQQNSSSCESGKCQKGGEKEEKDSEKEEQKNKELFADQQKSNIESKLDTIME